MKNFALLNDDNVVINISVADENWDSTGWIEYTGKNCGIGFIYDDEEKIFIAPKPFPSWIREGSSWVAPKEKPIDGKFYIWNETILDWVTLETLPI